MQTLAEVGKYVTDGKKVYPYNAHLDDMLANGKLQFCEKPTAVAASPRAKYRSPITFTPDERLSLAQRMNITLGELTNMSPQEFEAEMEKLENPQAAETGGFPA